jgi:hypothetical protein
MSRGIEYPKKTLFFGSGGMERMYNAIVIASKASSRRYTTTALNNLFCSDITD